MLWFDGKGVAHFKKSSKGVAQDTESVNGEINKVDRFKLLFEFGQERGVLVSFSIWVRDKVSFEAASSCFNRFASSVRQSYCYQGRNWFLATSKDILQVKIILCYP